MFSLGLYELLIIFIMVLLIVPVKDLPKIARNCAKIFQKIKNIYSKICFDLEKLSVEFKEDDNFKTWEDRVEEKRAEYNININAINNLIDKENDTSKSQHDKK